MALVAAIQMTTREDKEQNLLTAMRLIRQAAQQGAQWVGLPETFSWMGPKSDFPKAAEPLQGPTLTLLSELAQELGVAILAGSILESGAPDGRFYNTSVLLGPDGQMQAVYRKIHLFDVDLADGSTYRESEQVAPGKDVVVASTELGHIGLSVCYDVRFPELYREQARRGANVLSVPAAFTLMTGKDHWEVLLRARAIENQSWVVAPAQFGLHSENRRTFGHAMIIDPWGTVVAQASDGEGVAMAQVRHDVTQRVRTAVPALQHRQLK